MGARSGGRPAGGMWSVTALEATRALWDAADRKGDPICKLKPSMWDPKTAMETASAARTRMAVAANRCMSCPVLDECHVVRAADPSLEGFVLAGQTPRVEDDKKRSR